MPSAFEFSFEYLDLPVEELRKLIVEEAASFRAEREAMKRRRKDALAAKGRAKVRELYTRARTGRCPSHA